MAAAAKHDADGSDLSGGVAYCAHEGPAGGIRNTGHAQKRVDFGGCGAPPRAAFPGRQVENVRRLGAGAALAPPEVGPGAVHEVGCRRARARPEVVSGLCGVRVGRSSTSSCSAQVSAIPSSSTRVDAARSERRGSDVTRGDGPKRGPQNEVHCDRTGQRPRGRLSAISSRAPRAPAAGWCHRMPSTGPTECPAPGSARAGLDGRTGKCWGASKGGFPVMISPQGRPCPHTRRALKAGSRKASWSTPHGPSSGFTLNSWERSGAVQGASEELRDRASAVPAGPGQEGAPFAVKLAFGDVPRQIDDSGHYEKRRQRTSEAKAGGGSSTGPGGCGGMPQRWAQDCHSSNSFMGMIVEPSVWRRRATWLGGAF